MLFLESGEIEHTDKLSGSQMPYIRPIAIERRCVFTQPKPISDVRRARLYDTKPEQ
jgi:hypothetical protein